MEESLTKQAIFVITDISAYSQFMLSHKKALVHGQMIISELLNLIVQSKEPPLEIAKLEGDAVFLFAVKEDSVEFIESLKTKLSDWLVQLFESFDKKVKELKAYSICKCEACSKIDQLTLKIIVHSGEALFYKIGDFFELAGVDVIMLHRLLKNSVESDQYLLVTESASHDLVFPESIRTMEGEEEYDVGAVKTQVYVPEIPEYEVDDSLPFPDSNAAVEILRNEVRQEYSEVATNPQQGFHFHTGRPLTKIVAYPESWFEHVPERTLESFAGTGNPFSLGEIQPGERVVDIGSGAGFDCLIAGNFVGPSGHVIGVDMTPEMLQKARKSAEELGWTHVEFREGYSEHLPVEDGWADVVISNGVINLSSHKPTVFQEVYRILKPGGRMQIGDIILQRAVPESARGDIDLWRGCVAGALLEAEIETVVTKAGFQDFQVTWKADIFNGAPQQTSAAKERISFLGAQGVNYRARKPK